MKRLLIMLSLLSSVSAFASYEMQETIAAIYSINTPEGEVTGQQREDINKAVKEEFAKGYLTCSSGTGQWKNTEQAIAALSQFIDDKDTMLYLNEVQSQPVISYKAKSTRHYAYANITTTDDFKSIKMIIAESFTLTYTTTNVGTIINPRYEQGEVGKLYGNISCENLYERYKALV